MAAVAFVAGGGGFLSSGGALLWLRTPSGNRWITEQVVARTQDALVEGSLSVGAIDTDLFGDTRVRDVALRDGAGAVVVGFRQASVRYDLWPLVGKRVQLDAIEIHGLQVDLRVDARGVLNLSRMFGQTEPTPPNEAPWAGLPVAFDADAVGLLDADVRYAVADPGGGEDVVYHVKDLLLGGVATGVGRRVEGRDVVAAGYLAAPYGLPFVARGSGAFTGDEVALDDVRLWLPGTALVVRGDLTGLEAATAADLSVRAERLDLAVVGRIVAQPLRGAFSGEAGAQGPLTALAVTADLAGRDGTAGQARAGLVFDVPNDLRWSGQVDLQDLAVEQLYPLTEQSIVVNGSFAGTGGGTSWPDAVVADGHWRGALRVQQPGIDVVLDTLEGDVGLRQGTLTLVEVRAEGPLGPLKADGTVDLVGGGMDLRVRGALSGPALTAVGVDDVGGRPTVTARVTGDILADDLPLAADGTVVFAPFLYGDDVRAERLEARYAWSQRAGVQGVDLIVDGVGLNASGATADTFALPKLRVDLPLSGDVSAVGLFSATNASYDTAFSATTLAGDLDVQLAAAGGGPTVRSSMTAGPLALAGGFPGTGGAVDLRVDDWEIAFDVRLDGADRALLVTQGALDRVDGSLSMEHLAFAPTPRQSWRALRPIRLTVTEGGGIADADVAVGSGLGRVSIEGRLGAAGPLDGRIVVEGLSLDALAELFPETAGGLAGALDLDLRADGTADSPVIQAVIAGDGVWIPGVAQALDVRGRVSAVRESADLALEIGSSGVPLASVDGVLPVHLDLGDSPGLDPGGVADLDVVAYPGSIERLQWLSEADLGLPGPGVFSGRLTVDGVLRDPHITSQGVVEMEANGWSEPGRAEWSWSRRGGELSGWVDLREGLAARARAEGRAATRMGEVFAWALDPTAPEPDFEDMTLYADQLDVRAGTTGLPLASLGALVGDLPSLDGALTGEIRVSGPLTGPQLAAQVDLGGGGIGGVPLDGAHFDLASVDGGLEVHARAAFADGGLGVEGLVPLVMDWTAPADSWAHGENRLVVDGAGVPLAVLRVVDPTITHASGNVVVTGTIDGSPFAPAPHLRATVADGVIVHAGQGVRVRDLNLSATVDPDRLALEHLSMDTEALRTDELQGYLAHGTRRLGVEDVLGGHDAITGQGAIQLRDWTPVSGQIDARFTHALLSARPDQVLEISGDIALAGEWPGRLTGGVRFDRGRLVYGADAFADESAFSVDPAVHIHRGSAPERVPSLSETASASVWSQLQVDVGLDLNRAFDIEVELPFVDDYGAIGAFVSTATVTARLDSRDLAVEMQDGALAVVHDVEVVEGQVAIFRSRFDLDDNSSLVFLGDPANPLMDLHATTTVDSGDIRIDITGPAMAPEVAFTSDRFEQTEIFTVLITGEAPDEIGGTDVVGQTMGVLLDSVLGDSSTPMVNIDPSGKIRVSVLRTSRAKAEATWNLRPEVGENASEITAEYQLGPDALITAGAGETHRYLDVFWEYRF